MGATPWTPKPDASTTTAPGAMVRASLTEVISTRFALAAGVAAVHSGRLNSPVCHVWSPILTVVTP